MEEDKFDNEHYTNNLPVSISIDDSDQEPVVEIGNYIDRHLPKWLQILFIPLWIPLAIIIVLLTKAYDHIVNSNYKHKQD